MNQSAERRAEDLESLLSGERVRLRQYVPGHYQRGALVLLWRMLEQDGATLDVFFDSLAAPSPATPTDTRADAAEVLAYFSDTKKLLVFAEDPKTGELMGFFWLTDMIPHFRATVSLFFAKKFRGRAAFEAGRRFRDYAVDWLGFKTLWGVTPWKHSVAMGRWLGMRTVAVLPKFHLINGVAMDSYVLRYGS